MSKCQHGKGPRCPKCLLYVTRQDLKECQRLRRHTVKQRDLHFKTAQRILKRLHECEVLIYGETVTTWAKWVKRNESSH